MRYLKILSCSNLKLARLQDICENVDVHPFNTGKKCDPGLPSILISGIAHYTLNSVMKALDFEYNTPHCVLDLKFGVLIRVKRLFLI